MLPGKTRVPRGDVIVTAATAASKAINRTFQEADGMTNKAEIACILAVLQNMMNDQISLALDGPSEIDKYMAMFGNKLK